MDQKSRQAATPFSIGTRIKDAQLGLLRDGRRSDGHRKHSLPSVITAIVLGIASNLTSLRNVESMTSALSSTVRRMFNIHDRISDTTLSEGLMSASPGQLHQALVRLVLAEHRRGNLRPTPDLPGSVVALDGKHQATLSHGDLLRIARSLCDDPHRALDVDALKRLVTGAYPYVQISQDQEGRCWGLIRYHRVTLTSHPSHPCMLLAPIPGDTNEVGHAPETIRRLLHSYRNSRLIDIITMDAGNTSSKVARIIAASHKRYLLALKGNQPDTYAEAKRLLHNAEPALRSATEKVRGQRVTHHIYIADVTGGLTNFASARALVRVRREVKHPDDTVISNDSRYFVTNIDPEKISAKKMMALVRSHWRCENNGHWTSDAILGEDKRRVRFARGPHGIAVVALCRMIAQNILGQIRHLSRKRHTREKPSWREVIFHVIRAITGAVRHRSTFEVAVFC